MTVIKQFRVLNMQFQAFKLNPNEMTWLALLSAMYMAIQQHRGVDVKPEDAVKFLQSVPKP